MPYEIKNSFVARLNGALRLAALSLMLSVASVAQTIPGQPQAQQTSEADKLNAKVLSLAREGKDTEALALARRVLDIREKELGREHPSVASALKNVAALNQRLGKTEDAKSFYKRALAIYEKAGETYAPQVINTLDALVSAEDNPTRAVSLSERSLALKEKSFGAKSIEVSAALFRLGHLNELLGNYSNAEQFFTRFIEANTGLKNGEPDDLGVAHMRMSCLMRKKGKNSEAAKHQTLAEEVFRRVVDERGPVMESGIINGKAISKPQPAYPAEAKHKSAQGTIKVRMLVGETGTVLAACGEGGEPSLERASEFAAYSARFTPTLVNGKPVKVKGVITYNFVLQ